MESSSLHSVIILVPYSAMILYANYPNLFVEQSRMQYQPHFEEVPSYTFQNCSYSTLHQASEPVQGTKTEKKKKPRNKQNKNELNRNLIKILSEITINQLIILLYHLIFQSGSQPIIKF